MEDDKNLHEKPQPASRPRPRRGRILRVKRGYNPNSSSVGSLVFALPMVMLGVAAAFGAVAGVIFSVFLRKPTGTKEPKSAPEEGSADELRTPAEPMP